MSAYHRASIWVPDDERVVLALVSNKHGRLHPCFCRFAGRNRYGWWNSDYTATHWQPLPGPPAATQHPAAVVGNEGDS